MPLQYRSALAWRGIPLVHVAFGPKQRMHSRDGWHGWHGAVSQGTSGPAVGIIVVGNVALGVVALGPVALGLAALGVVAVGVIAGGVVTVGMLTAGMLTLGAVWHGLGAALRAAALALIAR